MRDRDYITDEPRASDARRFWCPYTALEEYHAGMWRNAAGESKQLEMIASAVSLLRSHEAFSAAISRVLIEWPTSCLAEFTSPGNHLAWLGQASCCLVRGVPEGLTRRAWWKLTEAEREDADDLARKAVKAWQFVNMPHAPRAVQLSLFETANA